MLSLTYFAHTQSHCVFAFSMLKCSPTLLTSFYSINLPLFFLIFASPPHSLPFFVLLSPLLRIYSRMGELEPWMDEGYIRGLWYQMGEQVNVKFIRDKFTG